MFGIFGKKTESVVWRQIASEQIEPLAKVTEQLAEAGYAVGQDFAVGWQAVVPILTRLNELEAEVSNIRSELKAIGSPKDSNELQTVKKTLDQAFDQLVLAFYWGKYHYKDASGGVSERAVYETGIAQRAAMKRLSNNGRRFAEASVNANTLIRSVMNRI